VGAIHTYAGYYHELFNEADAGRVFDDLRAWLVGLQARERGGILR
jgi:alpha-beta hydrolase superfamily lysophospholipase